ncbi:MAG: hypothetical protein PHX29_07400 [Dehalococcoidales bacterium]|jgi:hypothetical protein|nr:hypothetical protein [Dehalococcoidales bacterium]
MTCEDASNLEQQLIEGYQARAEEEARCASEWEIVSVENWPE